ncbi:protein penguin [Copidosoma floridanum]|uniref:protein penguin n=1 Tax=Copidosoma floridanum TaxID=29053 RepID=UPI0006C98717|nr:protein penguin [Copidosoma floridanum]
MAKFRVKKQKGDHSDESGKKKFKSKGNNKKNQKNFKSKPKGKTASKNKNASKNKMANKGSNKSAPTNKNTSQNPSVPVKKEEKENNVMFQKSHAVKSKSKFNKFKAAKTSIPSKPNMDLKRFKKSESVKEDTTGEKPNWPEYKKQCKEMREMRRAKKFEGTYDMAVEAKKLGEKLRNRNLNKEAQEKLTKNFHDLVQNQYEKLIYTHDGARVIQWHLKYCNPDIQLAIVKELQPNLKAMLLAKYARNVIKTLLRVGSDSVKKLILEACYGNVVKLLNSVLPSGIIEKIYVEVASEAEKCLLRQEFYMDIYKNSKDPNIKCLTDVYKNAESMKSITFSTVKSNLIKILNKNLINSTLVHTVMYEFLTNCSKEDKDEILALARPLVAELSQTKDGTLTANMSIWSATNKERKQIMKSLKEHVTKIATSEHGFLMILCLLDTIDDTVLLKKIILQEILNNLNEIVVSEFGRRVILYLVARRDTHYFHPALIESLKMGDGNETSKKPADLRQKEIFDNVIDHLLQSISSDVKMWLNNGPIQIVTLAILNACSGDKPEAAFEAVTHFICDPESKLQKDDKSVIAIEDAGLHMILKKLIQMDAKRCANNELTFGEVLVQYWTDKAIKHWIKFNRGCFLLVLLIENEPEDVVSKVKSMLKKQQISESMGKGASILLKKLESQ